MQGRSIGDSPKPAVASIRRSKSRFCLLSGSVLALTAILITTPAALAQQRTAIVAIVSKYGLRPIEPAVPAFEFTLPELGGGQSSLSDFAGRWVVLTFWATWCGPCRSEMPSLERLHLNRQAKGVSVIGITVDRQATPAERFVEEYGLTFPNLWDARGETASAYRAQSIPLSYLIDPTGRVVGVSLGARDWAALQPMMDALLKVMPALESEPEEYEATSASLETPRSLHPPSGEVRLLNPAPEVGEPFSVEVQVLWAGNFDEYLLHPPRLELPEGIDLEGQTAATSSSDGRSLVTYRIDLRAREEGVYVLSPLELVYTPRAESQPVSSRLEGPTVEVRPATVAGLTRARLGGLLATLVVLTAVALLTMRWFRARPAATEVPDASVYEGLKARLDHARGRRLEGDLSGAALALAELERELGVDGEAEAAALGRMIEGARYGGYAPSREELDQIERRVERRVRELETDPRTAERLALRLRNQES